MISIMGGVGWLGIGIDPNAISPYEPWLLATPPRVETRGWGKMGRNQINANNYNLCVNPRRNLC